MKNLKIDYRAPTVMTAGRDQAKFREAPRGRKNIFLFP